MDNNIQAFFELLRAGLWEKEARLSKFEGIDYATVMELAEEQSVVGLITAGLERVVDVKVPKDVVLQFVGSTLQIEQQNKAMNEFIARLIEKLRKADIFALLVKGQGIAQCYEKPLWRACGDVDLLLSTNNFIKANAVLDKIADNKEKNTLKNVERMHQEYRISDWIVELHGTMHASLSRKIDKGIDEVQREVFYGGYVRSWVCGKTQVFLPRADEDVIFVFTHILQHLFLEGIGLRQICDWCRLLSRYRLELDVKLLEKRLRLMGLMTEWKVFAALAVNRLGMPAEEMPLFDARLRWRKKADRICFFVMKVGNFGQNRDLGQPIGPVKRKLLLVLHKLEDSFNLLPAFPLDSPRFLMNYIYDSFLGK